MHGADRPTLVFDRATLVRNFAAIAAAARRHQITTLFAMKAFPHDEVLALARAHFDGFDVGSPAEAARAAGVRIISIADPTGLTRTADAERVLISTDDGTGDAIRISASLGDRDPAIGAIHDGDRRRSRFGIAHATAARGLHVHHGPITPTSAARFVATIVDALALVPDARLVNAGGAWHGLPLAELDATFAQLRAAVGDRELIVEPGRALARDAGFAVGAIARTRELPDGRQLLTTTLSKICHLRWSPAELVAHPPAAGGTRTIVVGPTCFEEDVLGEWVVDPAALERIVVRDVTGYAVAWNAGFGGLDPAEVVIA